MKIIFLIFGVLLTVAGFAQNPGVDYFQPYKYPKHYSHDGAYKLVELDGYLPSGNNKPGGDIKIDFLSIKLGTPALRLNFGLGFGYNEYTSLQEFTPTPLLNGSFGENSVADKHAVANLQLYPRLWIRVLDPFNISVAAGPLGYYDQNLTVGTFSLHDLIYGLRTIKETSQQTLYGAGYFYEAKGMLNFKNWGISGGIMNITINGKTIMQPCAGIWFGEKSFEKVNN